VVEGCPLPDVFSIWTTKTSPEMPFTLLLLQVDCRPTIFVHIGRQATQLLSSPCFYLLEKQRDSLPPPLAQSLPKTYNDMKKPILLIASPIARLRKRWRQPLRVAFAIHEVTERATLERIMENLKPAILLLDLAFPKVGGVRGVLAIQQLSPRTKIVLLSSTPNVREGLSALKVGIRGYCNRDVDLALLKNAVEIVQKGEIWVRPNLLSHLVEMVTSLTDHKPNTQLDHLTRREYEIACLVGQAASNKEIANQLNVTEKTVKAHLTTIFRKLRLSGRLQLALFMVEPNRVNH